MSVHKLQESDAFIVFDLEQGPHAGIVRAAPKILVDGATTLARSLTYLYATFEQQMGGASGGINTKPEDRAAAISGFVTEIGPRVADGSLQVVAGKGLGDADLEPLVAQQPGDRAGTAERHVLLGAGVVAAAAHVRPDLTGTRVVIDGLDAATTSVVRELAGAGATIVGVATTAGAVSAPGGIDPERLIGAVDEHGAKAIDHLDLEVAAAASVFAADADILFTGSKVGAIDHDIAAGITAGLVVPIGPVPVTAKALAVLRRADIVVLPDFVSAAGPWFATFADAASSSDARRAAVVDGVGQVLGEVLDHADGPLLAACYRAEAFLGTWQASQPFGRPLA